MVLDNDMLNFTGRPSINEKDERLNGLDLRDKFRPSLMYHEMRSPRKSEWDMDKYIHLNRN